MAEPLKRLLDGGVVGRIAAEVKAAYPPFDEAAFLAEALRGLSALGLTDRARHVAAALRSHLPRDPARAIGILVDSLGPRLEDDRAGGMAAFRYLPHGHFVSEHGLDCFEASMRAQHALTQRFTAEFSIRPFLERHPERTLARLATWTRDPSAHVRRLVSEGTRPRLPWAPRLKAFQADPSRGLALLERLKDDPSPYVRRSVANHLNDVGKDHPALLVQVCRRWIKGAGAERRWIVARALRSAVKRGDRAALSVLGYAGGAGVELVRFHALPARPRIGETVTLHLEVRNRGARPANVVVDVAIHFVKRGGEPRPKVMKVRALPLAPRERAVLRKRVSLAQHSTRTHHPGRHAVDVLVNGRAVPAGAFSLRPAAT